MLRYMAEVFARKPVRFLGRSGSRLDRLWVAISFADEIGIQ
jgi:hypothetical protein